MLSNFKGILFRKKHTFGTCTALTLLKNETNVFLTGQFFFIQRCLRQRWWRYFFEYLLVVETEAENNFNRGQKSRATDPLKVHLKKMFELGVFPLKINHLVPWCILNLFSMSSGFQRDFEGLSGVNFLFLGVTNF